MHIYKTTAENGTASYEIQKSRFIAYTSHVETEAEARDFVTAIKKKHFDARHNCSAWVLGADSCQQKSNDDGEPGGTAGNPILEAIKQHGLTNVVVVVTRYFGGIKLGAGGLIRLPTGTKKTGEETEQPQETAARPAGDVGASVQEEMEQRLCDALSQMEGVGAVHVVAV